MRHPDARRRKPATVVKDSESRRSQSTQSAVEHDVAEGHGQRKATDIITVLIVDEHTLLREGLHQLLELEGNITVIGEAADGLSALEMIRQLQPDIVLTDLHLPVIDGIALTRQITQQFPHIAVIILTIQQQGAPIVEALKCGARGYLLKSVSLQELLEAIRNVHAGEVVMSPALTGEIANELRRLPESGGYQRGLNQLSERELELVRYIATGLSNKEIAARLSYSEKTVKNYLSVIFQKLQLRDRTQVAIFALRQGLLPAPDQ